MQRITKKSKYYENDRNADDIFGVAVVLLYGRETE